MVKPPRDLARPFLAGLTYHAALYAFLSVLNPFPLSVCLKRLSGRLNGF